MSRIIRLQISNLLRVKCADIRPEDNLVLVGGRNDSGKSSTLNAVALALSGKDAPSKPIHDGAESGQVILETEELIVTRRFTESGSTLEVRDRAGARISRPQEKLDTLVSRVSFDPFEFTRQDAQKQLATLKTITGLDFTALDQEASAVFDKRTMVNRQIKELDAQLKTVALIAGVPEEEVKVADVLSKLDAAKEHNSQNQTDRETLSDLNDTIDTWAEKILSTKNQIKQLEELLSQQESDQVRMIQERESAKAHVANLKDIDTEPMLAEIRDADTINEQVRNNRTWREKQKEVEQRTLTAAGYTKRISEIAAEKERLLAAAPFPVEGLGFDDAGVTFKGIPFPQHGMATQLRVSVAIARSLNPKLPVMLVRDGSLLDDNSLALLKEEADTHGLQVWLEVVSSDAENCVVFMEDGVASQPAKKRRPSHE